MADSRVALRDAGLQVLFETELPVGLALLDDQHRYVLINQTLATFNGVAREQALGRSVAEVLPEAYPLLRPLLERVLLHGEALCDFRLDAEVPSQPGQLSHWEASYLPVRAASGEVVGVLVKAVNLSWQMAHERALRESEAHLRRVLDSLFAFVGVLTPEGVLVQANKAPLEAAGIRAEDVIGRPFWDTYWWNHDAALVDWMREAVARAREGQVTRGDVAVRMAGDSRMVIDFMLAPMRNDQGEITHLIPSAIDVSDRVEGEAALRASEARFRSVFEASPDGMALIEAPDRLVRVNASLCRIFGYRADALQGQSVALLLDDDHGPGHAELMQGFWSRPQERRMAPKREVTGRRADGSVVHVEVGLTPLPGAGVPQMLITVSDVTARMQAQQQIEQALREKTVLLNEVHHRVKNNLQIIASLLRLQSKHVDDPVRRVLGESRSRVKAMALTHQLLYECHDFAGLELGLYLKRLAHLLRETHLPSDAPQAQAVLIDVQAAESGLRIDLQRAVPCALLVNELVTNAIKHAFPNGRAGRIGITADAGPAGSIVLSFEDDGVGIPRGVRLGQQGTLGFQLVPLLAAQLDASIDIEAGRAGGARFVVNIPPAEVSP